MCVCASLGIVKCFYVIFCEPREHSNVQFKYDTSLSSFPRPLYCLWLRQLVTQVSLFDANTLLTRRARPRSPQFQPRERAAPPDVHAHPLTMTELCRWQLTSILYIWTQQGGRGFEPSWTWEGRSSQAAWGQDIRTWSLSKAAAAALNSRLPGRKERGLMVRLSEAAVTSIPPTYRVKKDKKKVSCELNTLYVSLYPHGRCFVL